LDVLPVTSEIFPGQRNLRVLLPAGYRDPANRTRRYPVLYLNDGQSVFGTCSGVDWQADRVVADLIRARRIPPIIVVGIENGGRRLRAKEYLPWGDERLIPPEPDPAGKFYPAFLLEEVIPLVQRRYRIATGPANRVLGGSDYGAGAALFAAMERPGSFGALLLESPAITPDNYHLLRNAEVVRVWPRRIYISAGDRPEEARRLTELLRKKKVQVHTGTNRLTEALPFLFGPKR
jgi:enterochelin esterase-like enzyme